SSSIAGPERARDFPSGRVLKTPPTRLPRPIPPPAFLEGNAPLATAVAAPPVRSGLLSTSLQRVYGTAGDPVPMPSLTATASRRAPVSVRSGKPAVQLIESFFDVGDLDPLPFLNRRQERSDADRASLAAGAGKTESAAIPSPPLATPAE